MSEFCDVALPVPLDLAFTYRIPADAAPVARLEAAPPAFVAAPEVSKKEVHAEPPAFDLELQPAAPAADKSSPNEKLSK